MSFIRLIKEALFSDHIVNKSEAKEIVFAAIPDGKYLAKYLGEKILNGHYILCMFEVTFGPHKSEIIPMKFDNAKAKTTMRERRSDWIEYLALGEGDKKAIMLYEALLNSNGEFLVTVKGHHITSIPEPDADKELLYKQKGKHV